MNSRLFLTFRTCRDGFAGAHPAGVDARLREPACDHVVAHGIGARQRKALVERGGANPVGVPDDLDPAHRAMDFWEHSFSAPRASSTHCVLALRCYYPQCRWQPPPSDAVSRHCHRRAKKLIAKEISKRRKPLFVRITTPGGQEAGKSSYDYGYASPRV